MVYRRCGTGWATGASAPSYRRTTGLPSAQWHSPETGNTFCHPERWDTRYYIRPQQSIAICLICLYARTRWWSCGSCPRRGVWSPTQGRARRASRSTRPRPSSTTPRTTSCSPTRPPPPSAAGTPGNTQSNLSRLPFDCLNVYILHICSLLRNASRKQLLSLGHNGSVRWMVHSPTQAAFLSCSDDFRWGYNLSGSRSYSCESLNLYIYFIYNWVMSIKTFWEFLFPNSAVISIISRARFWFRRQ